MKTTFATVITRVSFEEGLIGQQAGEPEVTEYPDGKSACAALNAAIDANRHGDRTFFIRFPSGKLLPLDGAYSEIFGERPRYGSRNEYPRLKPSRAKGRDKAKTTLSTTDVLAVALTTIERLDRKGSARGTADVIRRHIGELNRPPYLDTGYIKDGKPVVEMPLPWHVVTVSTNANAFGYRQVLVIRKDGEGRVCHFQAYGSDPVPKHGDLLETIPDYLTERLKTVTPELARKVIAEIHA